MPCLRRMLAAVPVARLVGRLVVGGCLYASLTPAVVASPVFPVERVSSLEGVQAPRAEPLLLGEVISSQVRQIIDRSYPELQGLTFEHLTLQSPDVFFTSNVNLSTLWPTLWSGKPRDVVYRINYNPDFVSAGCPPEAVEAILAHELAHTLDYVEGGVPALLGVLNAIRLPQSNARYERRTDLRAIFRGYGKGLMAYRQWIYARLTPAELRLKRLTYYTPAEIALLMKALEASQNQEDRLALEARWWADPPLSRKAILASL